MNTANQIIGTNGTVLNGYEKHPQYQVTWIRYTCNPINESGLCVSEFSNLTISSNIESLFISNESTTQLSGDINITGDINNNGTLNAISGSLSMNGGNDQFLTGTGTTTLNNFTINKTSGDFIMNTPLTVTNNLSLTSGIIQKQ